MIDVEGGVATLTVTPVGGSILMDDGWYAQEARDAWVDSLDFFIASHFYSDHVGGWRT